MSRAFLDRRQLLASLGVAASGAQSTRPDPPPADGRRGTGAIRRVEEFGAMGNGETDDSAAFERALASAAAGEVISLGGGRSYRLTRSLVFTRPLVIVGGTKESTRLLFDDGSYAKLGGIAAAIILPHERGRADAATARRTVMSGFTVAWIGKQVIALHGCLIAAPVYLDKIDVISFPGDGYRIEAETKAISGNANGSSFTDCSAKGNSGNGFAFHGNDANACLLLGSRAFDNRRAGFYDGSLLGNTYVAGEVDGNGGAGFASIKTTPNRSVYIGCYAEPNQRYDLNERNLVVGALGHVTGDAAAMMRALPSGELFGGSGQVFADSENIAAGAAGACLRVSGDGFDLRAGDGQRVRLSKLLSSNYVDFLNGDRPLIRFPSRDVAGNVTAERPWLPTGLVVGDDGRSGVLGAGPRPPAEGRFAAGALWLNDDPRPNGFVGWVCVASGQPGLWLPFGRIEGTV